MSMFREQLGDFFEMLRIPFFDRTSVGKITEINTVTTSSIHLFECGQKAVLGPTNKEIGPSLLDTTL